MDFIEDQTVSGSGVSWAICKSASLSRQDYHASTPPVFCRLDALPAAQPTASKHCLQGKIAVVSLHFFSLSPLTAKLPIISKRVRCLQINVTDLLFQRGEYGEAHSAEGGARKFDAMLLCLCIRRARL